MKTEDILLFWFALFLTGIFGAFEMADVINWDIWVFIPIFAYVFQLILDGIFNFDLLGAIVKFGVILIFTVSAIFVYGYGLFVWLLGNKKRSDFIKFTNTYWNKLRNELNYIIK